MPHQPHPQTFSIDNLLNELQIEVKEQLQNAGKPEIDVEIYRYSDEHTCSILADRERVRQALSHLLGNAVKFIDRGFMVFGYHVLHDNIVDFFVDDTGAGKYNDTPPDLSPVRDLLQTMGSHLKEKITGTGASYSFSIECEQVELTKIT